MRASTFVGVRVGVVEASIEGLGDSTSAVWREGLHELILVGKDSGSEAFCQKIPNGIGGVKTTEKHINRRNRSVSKSSNDLKMVTVSLFEASREIGLRFFLVLLGFRKGLTYTRERYKGREIWRINARLGQLYIIW